MIVENFIYIDIVLLIKEWVKFQDYRQFYYLTVTQEKRELYETQYDLRFERNCKTQKNKFTFPIVTKSRLDLFSELFHQTGRNIDWYDLFRKIWSTNLDV